MKTDDELQKIVAEIKSADSKLLSRLISEANTSSRKRREVNLSKINRFAKENETIIVPGKVLGGGDLNHKVTISAFKFSSSAMSKIEKSGSTIVPFREIVKEPLQGKRIRIIG